MAVSLVFVVCFVSSVVSQAPGDGDSFCVDEFVNGSRNPYFDLRPTYPANVRPLMDSRDYVGLLQGSDNLPWQQVDNDDNNTAQVATEVGLIHVFLRVYTYNTRTWYMYMYSVMIRAASMNTSCRCQVSVGPPTEPEVHHARTAEFCLHEFAVTGIFANYIFTQPFLRICS